MQIIKKQERVGEILFYIGIILHILIMVVGYGEWTVPFHGRIMQVVFGLFCIKILLTYYTKKEWIIMILLGILGVVSYLFTKDEYVVSVIVMIFAAKSVDMRRVCRMILYAAFVSTVITAVFSLIGIGGVAVDIRDFGRGAEEARWCFGFGHANNIHGTIWYLILLGVFLYFDRLQWQHYLLMTLVNVGLFYLTASRSGMLAAQITIVAALILKYYPKVVEKVWIYLLGVLELCVFVVLSLVCAVISPEFTPFISTLDNLLTGRLHLIRWYGDMSKWKLFANGNSEVLIDDGWAGIFLSYGYVVGIVFILFHCYLLYRAWQKKNGLQLIMVATSMFYIFMEASYMINSSYLLCNLSYIAAMLLWTETNDREGRTNESV